MYPTRVMNTPARRATLLYCCSDLLKNYTKGRQEREPSASLDSTKLDCNEVVFVHAIHLYNVRIAPFRRESASELQHDNVWKDLVIEEPAETSCVMPAQRYGMSDGVACATFPFDTFYDSDNLVAHLGLFIR